MEESYHEMEITPNTGPPSKPTLVRRSKSPIFRGRREIVSPGILFKVAKRAKVMKRKVLASQGSYTASGEVTPTPMTMSSSPTPSLVARDARAFT
jgi:hypothetical protein